MKSNSTVVQQLLQVVRVTSELQDESGASDLLWDALIEQLDILVHSGYTGLFV